MNEIKKNTRESALYFLNKTLDMNPKMNIGPLYTPMDLVMLYEMVGSLSAEELQRFQDTNDIDRYYEFIEPMVNKVLEMYPDIHPVVTHGDKIDKYV